jgi:SAM-dependent methyltransferase
MCRMTLPKTPEEVAARYDLAHDATARPLMRRLTEEAYGADSPGEVDPFSSCTWWTLGQFVAALRLRPGSTLVDLGCGRGGVGLWLARACACDVIGVDISPSGVAHAARRAAEFVPDGRARFQVGTFDATGLPDACADGAVSMDALPFAPDRAVALTEVRRILRPGGRLAFTGVNNPAKGQAWEPLLAGAGLRLVDRLPVKGWADRWLALYALWLAHEDELRAEVGEAAAEALLREARDGERLLRLEPYVFVAERT